LVNEDTLHVTLVDFGLSLVFDRDSERDLLRTSNRDVSRGGSNIGVDGGASERKGLIQSLDEMCGTIEYAPPEVLMMLEQASEVLPLRSRKPMRSCVSHDNLASLDSHDPLEGEEHEDGIDVFAMDAWALGVVLYAMLFGTMPFNDSQRRMMASLGKHPAVPIPPRALSHPGELCDAMDLLRQMLDLDPSKRPSLEEVSRHRWVAAEFAKVAGAKV
jgi:serine/threonine protein kinase